MGVSYYNYVGPYVKVYIPPKNSTIEFYGCPKPTCRLFRNSNSSKFCAECGSEIKLLSRPHKKPTEFDCNSELDENLTPAFCGDNPCKDYEVLIPNKKIKGINRDCFYNTIYDTCEIIIEQEQVKQETTLFKDQFKKEISYLCQKFGNDAVLVYWGVLNWGN